MDFQYLFLIGVAFLLICLIIAQKNYHKYKDTSEKFFLHFLGYTFLTELIGLYTAYVLEINFTVIYNIFIIVSFLYYFYWFYTVLKVKNQRIVIVFLSILFFIFGVYNFITIDHYNFHGNTFVFGALVNVLTSFFLFAQLLNDKEQIEIRHNLKFWIATGLLLFNVGIVPLMMFSEQFNAYHNVRTVILQALNVILYSCYSLGFILCKEATEK